MRESSPNVSCPRVEEVKVLWGQSGIEQTALHVSLSLRKPGTAREKFKG